LRSGSGSPVFAITTDPFIVYTSNICATLGLRALYFAQTAMVHRFHDLKYALSVLLMFIGAKVFAGPLLGFVAGNVPASLSLGVTLVILAAGVGWSLWITRAPVTAT
jgi:tellurite resistance protein TerC